MLSCVTKNTQKRVDLLEVLQTRGADNFTNLRIVLGLDATQLRQNAGKAL